MITGYVVRLYMGSSNLNFSLLAYMAKALLTELFLEMSLLYIFPIHLVLFVHSDTVNQE